MRLSRRTVLAGMSAVVLTRAARAQTAALKIGVLKFGTVQWLLDVIQAHELDRAEGMAIAPVELANNQAGTIALMAGSADVIVSDWPWALRQRAEGEDMRFSPYSGALGGVMVPRDSPVRGLADLAGKRIGVAGSAIDKSWIMLRARARAVLGRDLAEAATPLYAAPPLLSEELRAGRIDAVLTFWNFAARLAAAGFERIIDLGEVQADLGLSPPPPMVGFVWRATSVADAPVAGLLRAAAAANRILATSDGEWNRIRPLVRAANDAELAAIMAYYRAGIPGPWTAAETRSAAQLFQLLADLGGPELVGRHTLFDPALFGSTVP